MHRHAHVFIGKMQSLPRFKILLAIVLLICAGYIAYTRLAPSIASIPQYRSSTVEKGTLVLSVTSSGQIASTNSRSVTTNATGVVKMVYVRDSDVVSVGDKIADIELDLSGQQSSATAWSAYQSAKNNLESAKANLYTLQSTMLTEWKDHYALATNSTYQNTDGTPNTDNRVLADFHISQDDWLAAEARYKNQQSVVAQAQTALNAAYLSYQQSSSTIYAPISGVVVGLSLQEGTVISPTSSSSTTSTTSTGTKIATIKTDAPPVLSVSVTEVDVPKIKIGNKVSITLDAFAEKTFTGKVISIDTTGSVSSGVTTYPVVISFDSTPVDILPNMAASATIITQTKHDVLTVPSSYIQTQDNDTFVRVLTNGSIAQVPVETGLSSGSATEITSGLTEGDTVITYTQTTSGTNTRNTQSPFSGFGGSGGFRIR